MPQPAAELGHILRALPVAIAAARIPEGPAITLSFGRSLDVELRAGPGGIEIVLRPEAQLLAAAEGELPRVLASLRERGVRVGRAEVRARGAAPAQAPPGEAGAARGGKGRRPAAPGGGEAR